ncbi:MAG: DUF1501 domain-containing protein [Planctomycetaceae bacterium]|nr:DUF1501 domain-containing protein [Planctomycetaceae bacterium]
MHVHSQQSVANWRRNARSSRLDSLQEISRREIFSRVGTGVGSIALASMLIEEQRASAKLVSPPENFTPRAKNVIFMHMVGGPSHLDLFDHKPELVRLSGQSMPDELWEGLRLAFIREKPNLLGTQFKFRRHGESGLELSETLPHLGEVADELCVIKSLHTDHFNHGPAQMFFQTGFGQFGRPSLGAWVSYGLGSENKNLPDFVVLNSGTLAGAGNSMWGSGFLPSKHQGIEFRSEGDPVLFLSNPEGIDDERRRRIVDSVNDLNRTRLADVGDPEIATRISQYEMAYRMQSAVPELMDLAGEPAHIHEMYGTDLGKESFANQCLLARRLVERGVRFVQLNNSGWDHHSSVFSNIPKKSKDVDRPMAALIKDLKSRGLLEDTLVVWGAEFGRTPMVQGKPNDGNKKTVGRDHHKDAYCVWIAGGGVKGGVSYGKSDDIGFNVVEDPMHVNDFHATILHLLGLDHEALTFKFQGRNFRLTDVAGNVAEKIIA